MILFWADLEVLLFLEYRMISGLGQYLKSSRLFHESVKLDIVKVGN